jgi:hypothetical protein
MTAQIGICSIDTFSIDTFSIETCFSPKPDRSRILTWQAIGWTFFTISINALKPKDRRR